MNFQGNDLRLGRCTESIMDEIAAAKEAMRVLLAY